MKEQFGTLAPTIEKLYPVARFASPYAAYRASLYAAYRTVMADSGSVCPMLQLDSKASKFMPVDADLNADADNPAGEDTTDVLGAQHSGTNALEHFDTSKLDANQAALQQQILLEWTHLARTGNPVFPHTPTWPRYTAAQHPVRFLQPGDTPHDVSQQFVAAARQARELGTLCQQ